MNSSISKTFLEQKLEETSALFEKVESQEKKDTLREEAYWLTQALESKTPEDVLTRAFSFWEKSNGKTGLKPFKLPTETSKEIPPQPLPTGRQVPFPKGGNAPPAMLTLWGMLDRAFQSGEGLDDQHVSDIFNRLPPASQTHFIDTLANHIRESFEEQTHIKKTPPDSYDISSILKDEALLLSLVEKTKQTVQVKEENIQRLAQKFTDWLRYNQNAPATEERLEEALYGPEALKTYMVTDSGENVGLRQKVMEGGALTPKQEETILAYLPAYERLIRDRLRMSTAEYLRLRHVSVEKLLDAVPPDPKQLALVAQSAVRQDLLAVPDAEFQKRVRAAILIRAYSFSKELRRASIRQFFRGVVEK